MNIRERQTVLNRLDIKSEHVPPAGLCLPITMTSSGNRLSFFFHHSYQPLFSLPLQLFSCTRLSSPVYQLRLFQFGLMLILHVFSPHFSISSFFYMFRSKAKITRLRRRLWRSVYSVTAWSSTGHLYQSLCFARWVALDNNDCAIFS